MRTFTLLAAIAVTMSAALPGTAGTLPDFRQNSQSGTPGAADDARARASAAAFALRRESAITLAQTGNDLPAARKAVAAILADPLFPTLSPAEQRDVISSAAWIEVRSAQYRPAAEFYRRAVALDPSDPDDWHRLSMAEDELGNHDAAADALRRILTDWPHLTDALSGGHVNDLIDNLPPESDSRLALMTTLFDADWKREEETASALWYELALTLAERGDRDGARTVISRIGWPAPLMRMQSDRRFDGLLPSDPAYVVDALGKLIERLAVLCADNPRNLYTHNEWLEALLRAGRNDEAIAISGTILDAIAAAPPEHPAFHDSDDENFTLQARADALRRTGRLDEAATALARASTLTEYGEANVSQKLALATLYNGLSRPDDATDAVRDVRSTAEHYSLMRRELIRMQAALLKGDRRKADASLERIRRQDDEMYGLVTSALLHAGRVEEAAGVFIRRLDDKRERGDALLMAQDSLEPEPLPGDRAYRRNRAAMLERSEVKAAIEAVGRVQHYDVW